MQIWSYSVVFQEHKHFRSSNEKPARKFTATHGFCGIKTLLDLVHTPDAFVQKGDYDVDRTPQQETIEDNSD